jgi:hypothetical protein
MNHNPATAVTVTLREWILFELVSDCPAGKAPILTSFAQAISDAFKAARDHALLVRDIDEAKHIAICEQFESRLATVFAEASAANGALRAHQQVDANRRAKIYSLSIKRNFLSSSTLHFRVDATSMKVWWQLCDTPAVREYAGWGWFVVPVLTVPDFDSYLQQKVLELIGTLQEDETTGAVIRGWGSQF